MEDRHLTGTIKIEMERTIIEISIITETGIIEIIRTETITRGTEDHHLIGIIKIGTEETVNLIEIPEEILMTVRTGTEIIKIEIIIREMEDRHLTGITETEIIEIIRTGIIETTEMVKGIDVLSKEERMTQGTVEILETEIIKKKHQKMI